MLPFKYRQNKISSISFRNVSTINRKYYIEIEPLNTSDEETIVPIKPFKTSSTPLCIVRHIAVIMYRTQTLKWKINNKSSLVTLTNLLLLTYC